ncbi:hypothetical protein BKA70DRAFT_58610 [Coprinopsis sp. MPI-PUGE-AT-0042]|nr:hypothetical protein BKA70DRAFT_58610 [Coprinopsis sp. MPI-PUGE-AT-0042]
MVGCLTTTILMITSRHRRNRKMPTRSYYPRLPIGTFLRSAAAKDAAQRQHNPPGIPTRTSNVVVEGSLFQIAIPATDNSLSTSVPTPPPPYHRIGEHTALFVDEFNQGSILSMPTTGMDTFTTGTLLSSRGTRILGGRDGDVRYCAKSRRNA